MSLALTSAAALQDTRICSIESKGAGQGHRSQAGLLVGLSLASFHLSYSRKSDISGVGGLSLHLELLGYYAGQGGGALRGQQGPHSSITSWSCFLSPYEGGVHAKQLHFFHKSAPR